MKVKLISRTENPIETMFVAARTCYSEESPIVMSEKTIVVENAKKLIKNILSSGHQSIAEHVNFSFAIEGISRHCSHQLVRHRAGIVFSQQSQRYVEIKEDYKLFADDNTVLTEENYLEKTDLINILDKYFIWDHNNYAQCHSLVQALYCYLYQIQEMGMKAEDARAVLPNATKTNVVMTCNLRELIHICNLRLCARAEKEITELFKLIKEIVTNENEFIGQLLVPNCESLGFCPEHKGCGRYAKK